MGRFRRELETNQVEALQSLQNDLDPPTPGAARNPAVTHDRRLGHDRLAQGPTIYGPTGTRWLVGISHARWDPAARGAGAIVEHAKGAHRRRPHAQTRDADQERQDEGAATILAEPRHRTLPSFPVHDGAGAS